MNSMPAEVVAQMMSYIPFDSRRLSTANPTFQRAYNLWLSKKKVSVDLTVFNYFENAEIKKCWETTQKKGEAPKVSLPMKFVIKWIEGTVTFKITDNGFISFDQLNDFELGFCRNFFSFAEICGMVKAKFSDFLNQLVPLIIVRRLNMMDGNCLRIDLLEAIRKHDCKVEILFSKGRFVLGSYYYSLFDSGKREVQKERLPIHLQTFAGVTYDKFHKPLTKYVEFSVITNTAAKFVQEMVFVILSCREKPEFTESVVVLRGNQTFGKSYNFLKWISLGNTGIEIEEKEGIARAETISDLPTQFEVKFPFHEIALEVFLENDDKEATFRFARMAL